MPSGKFHRFIISFCLNSSSVQRTHMFLIIFDVNVKHKNFTDDTKILLNPIPRRGASYLHNYSKADKPAIGL